ncbi:MAG: methylated-DNA--[protein]-cysteine S-methyltransferase [Puniceicoccaceae bacterium]
MASGTSTIIEADCLPRQPTPWPATSPSQVPLAATFASFPFGEAVAILSPGGVCALALGPSTAFLQITLDRYRASIPGQTIAPPGEHSMSFPYPLFDPASADLPHLIVSGTPFQLRVWQATARIPFGEVRTYTQIAQQIGSPQASRAVGSALAANQIAFAIPCHRVVRADHAPGSYRWGAPLKERILSWEQAFHPRPRARSLPQIVALGPPGRRAASGS